MLTVVDAATRTRRPWFLRPRGRATVVVIVLGLPLLLACAAAHVLPGALWFDELGQRDVFLRVAAAKAELWLLAAAIAAPVVALNLCVALARAGVARTRASTLAVLAVSGVLASSLASHAASHWQTFLLWRHRQPFGVVDRMSGRDVGFFVFSLPLERLASGLLLGLITVTTAIVAAVYRARGELTLRQLRVRRPARAHLAALAAAFLLVLAWRFRLERYELELGQQPFAGAGYVDVHVRAPGLTALSILSVLTALVCVIAPRRAIIPAAALAIAMISFGSWLPAVVQRFAVEPNPLLSEQRFVERSIAATRHGLALDRIEVHPYAPTKVDPADIPPGRFDSVQVWDTRVLEERMRDLVTDTPHFRPGKAAVDIVRSRGRPRLIVASARELDLRHSGADASSWDNDRLSYTHGLGLPRYSATAIERNGQPKLLDGGTGIAQPRIYFGDLPPGAPEWVLVNTRRPEVDRPASRERYHYTGPAGIALSSPIERALFAVALGSRKLLISDDVTRASRVVLHRDVRERLAALAPFIRWDAHPVALPAGGRIVYMVDGYTTSADYPYGDRVALGGAAVSYARSAVRATVDAFSGAVRLYLTDASDPIARAWAAAFPSLFRAPGTMPAWLRRHARYPIDLFKAQATAYQRFHTTRADVFASGAEAWSPPASLSGAIEVAGNIHFDEDNEDDLRRRIKPGYKIAAPPGRRTPQLLLVTSYSPRRAENLVASLEGWVDGRGRARLAARVLPAEPRTLGPAQVSRLVFSTPRVSELLGLTNLELRDLSKSSLDTVSLGAPHLLYLPGGVVQVQSLYKGASGPGVSRLIGVTAFVNGRAGVGSDVAGAVRQALNEPPGVEVLKPRGPAVIGTPVVVRFRVRNARRETLTIETPTGRWEHRRAISAGVGSVVWVPDAPGRVRVRAAVEGVDGSTAIGRTGFRVLSPRPAVRLTHAPRRARVGQMVRFRFAVKEALSEVAEVSTRHGTYTRSYRIRKGTGFIEWTPTAPGPAELRVRVRGRDGQTATGSARLEVAAGHRKAAAPDPPAVTLLRYPRRTTAGRTSEIVFKASGTTGEAVARITGDEGEARVWLFDHATGRTALRWTPARPGAYRLTISAQTRSGATAQATVPLTVAAR
jgi:uncharacterized membrane protein (UPF0182 family)